MEFGDHRHKAHSSIATELTKLSDAELSVLLAKGDSLHTGIGGTSVRVNIRGTPVFAKKVPLTVLESKPENARSTTNIFGLPLFCQYGIGSPGFGAWRELAANEIATRWVLTGECTNFPILHHWRILPVSSAAPPSAAELENLEREVEFWENSTAVQKRLEAIQSAPGHLVLFTEYFPQNLLAWMGAQFEKGVEASAAAIAFVDKQLNLTNAFMSAQGFAHFDTHFENIMTDGKQLYFSDFGLALSAEFKLTAGETQFLKAHQSYDHCRSAVACLHSISTSFLGKENWKENLRQYLKTEQPLLPPAVAECIRKYAPPTVVFLEFSQRLRDVSKQTPYPTDQLTLLLASPGLRGQTSG